MGASPTIYCLDNVTDYLQFERLCHDLMSLEGYKSIEPLGGFSDKGRDAIEMDTSNQTTIFAYSVREDWYVKLMEDSRKIHKYGHTCDKLVFITTAHFSASERDVAVNSIYDDFGWTLDLYGVERLRVLLDAKYPPVKLNHPQIFPPEFITLQTRIDAPEKRNHLFISYSPEDSIFAGWLTQKLTSEGYQVWCEQFKLLGGESYPDDIDEAIKSDAFRVLALYSQASLANLEVMRQRALALSISKERDNDFLIPLKLDGFAIQELDKISSSFKFITFEVNWALGLRQLLAKLKSIDCPKPVYNGKTIAAETFLEKDVIAEQSELLYSNCFEVMKFPKMIHRLKPKQKITYEDTKEFQFQWAHRRVNDETILSFQEPPYSIQKQYQFTPNGGGSCADTKEIDGIKVPNLIAELIRKSLIVKCHEKGLLHCPITNLHYFPFALLPGNRLNYIKPDGAKTFVSTSGERKYWKPSGSEYYRYYLAPDFYISQRVLDEFVVLLNIRLRFSDTDNKPLPSRTALSRRKHLCSDWWNHEWLNRVFAIFYYLSDGNLIVVGNRENEQVIINATPFSLEAPKGIDESRLDFLKAQDIQLWGGQYDELELEEEDNESRVEDD